MAIILKKKAAAPPLAEDIYLGVCYAVIDLGRQYSERYKKSSEKIMLIWEITGETVEIDGKSEPRVISKDYSASFNDKSNLKILINSWLGKDSYSEETGFDIKNFLGKPCQLEISIEEKDDGSKYNRLTNIMRLAKGQTAHEPKELIYYEIGDESTHGVFEKIPEWIQDRIKKSIDFENFVDIPDKPTNETETSDKSNKTEVPF